MTIGDRFRTFLVCSLALSPPAYAERGGTGKAAKDPNEAILEDILEDIFRPNAAREKLVERRNNLAAWLPDDACIRFVEEATRRSLDERAAKDDDALPARLARARRAYFGPDGTGRMFRRSIDQFRTVATAYEAERFKVSMTESGRLEIENARKDDPKDAMKAAYGALAGEIAAKGKIEKSEALASKPARPPLDVVREAWDGEDGADGLKSRLVRTLERLRTSPGRKPTAEDRRRFTDARGVVAAAVAGQPWGDSVRERCTWAYGVVALSRKASETLAAALDAKAAFASARLPEFEELAAGASPDPREFRDAEAACGVWAEAVRLLGVAVGEADCAAILCKRLEGRGCQLAFGSLAKAGDLERFRRSVADSLATAEAARGKAADAEARGESDARLAGLRSLGHFFAEKWTADGRELEGFTADDLAELRATAHSVGKLATPLSRYFARASEIEYSPAGGRLPRMLDAQAALLEWSSQLKEVVPAWARRGRLAEKLATAFAGPTAK